jgi:trigger factor
MAELVDALALGASGATRGGSSPPSRTLSGVHRMRFDIEKVSPIEQKLVFNIPAADIGSRMDTAFKQLQGNVNLPGFRKGKAPRKLIERRFGARVRAEVTNEVINESFKKAASDLEFFGRPSVDAEEVKSGEDFSFSVTVEVKPELTVTGYDGIEIDYTAPVVDEGEVERIIESQLQSQAVLTDVEDRPVSSTDMVMLELKIKDGKTVVQDHPGTMVHMAEEPYFTGLEPLLEGVDKGGKFKGEVTFAETAQIEEIAGKTLKVEGKVLAIQAMKLPDLSDDIAKDMGYEDGAEGMRNKIREHVTNHHETTAKNQARANLLEKLLEANPFDAPKGLIAQQFQALIQELQMQATYRGQDPKKLNYTQQQVQELEGRANFAAKSALVIESVAKSEGIEATDADVDAKFQELADARGEPVEAVRGHFGKEGAVEDLKARLVEEKTLDWLLDHAKLVKAKAPAAKKPAAKKAPAKKTESKAKAPAAKKPAAKKTPAKKTSKAKKDA